MKHKRKKENNTLQYVMLGLAFLLLLFTATETVRINAMQEVGPVQIVASQNAPTAGQSTPTPAPVQAPTMVGGC